MTQDFWSPVWFEENQISSKSWILVYIVKAVFVLFIFAVSFFLWRIYEKINSKNSSSIETSCINQDAYCILNINEVTPLWIKWKIEAWDIKIIAWKEVVSWKDTEFQMNIAWVYKNISSVIPQWSKYFASKKWKKLYSINDSKKLNSLSPKNLIFFNSLEEGKNAWFEL